MSLWFDMTYSLVTWQSGVIGIVRAELEMAKQFKKIQPDLKIVVWDGKNFRHINDSEIDWLWNSDNITDAYLNHFDRFNKKSTPVFETPHFLNVANAYNKSRVVRFKKGIFSLFNTLPFPFNWIFTTLFLPLGWLLSLLSKIYAVYMDIMDKKRRAIAQRTSEDESSFQHPFEKGDVFISCGWYDSNKEEPLVAVKEGIEEFKIIYLIYDLVLVNKETKALYSSMFAEYLEWISYNCDFTLFGGKTAKEDAQAYWRKEGLRVPPGKEIHFGADVAQNSENVAIETVLEKYSIEKQYMLTVGSIDTKKNQDVLYRAYTYLHDTYNEDEYPQLVIVGGKFTCQYLVDCIEQDPKVKKKITIIRATDGELKTLYENAMFTALPSLYEGWSLTLPEALNYGKLCLASDVRPLREIGTGFCDFIDPYDMVGWGKKIKYYFDHVEELRRKEKYIRDNWKPITWRDCGKELKSVIDEWLLSQEKKVVAERYIYFDITVAVSVAAMDGSVSGILRTQLTFARKLNALLPNVRFCAFWNNRYIAFSRNDLAILLDSNLEVDKAFEKSKLRIRSLANSKTSLSTRTAEIGRKESLGLIFSALPGRIQKKILVTRRSKIEKTYKDEMVPDNKLKLNLPFNKNDLFISVGIGFGISIQNAISLEKEKKEFKFAQLIYDFTPIIVPQTHQELTVLSYKPFLKWCYETADVIFYGGQNAMDDGLAYSKNNGLPEKPGYVVRFGSDISDNTKKELITKEKIEEKYGIVGPFLLTVGSIEPRKNYETLYYAYLKWLERRKADTLPQLVIAGYPGWKTDEFLTRLMRDEIVRGKIIICSPSDAELEYMYRNCDFTILASLYEGWSLTLPQSMNYNKFCLASNVKPLVEIGGDFLDYVAPLDTFGWVEKMDYYFFNRDILKEKEAYIASEWHSITWDECAEKFAEDVISILEED